MITARGRQPHEKPSPHATEYWAKQRTFREVFFFRLERLVWAFAGRHTGPLRFERQGDARSWLPVRFANRSRPVAIFITVNPGAIGEASQRKRYATQRKPVREPWMVCVCKPWVFGFDLTIVRAYRRVWPGYSTLQEDACCPVDELAVSCCQARWNPIHGLPISIRRFLSI